MAKGNTKNNNTAAIGLEAKLWAAADALRNNMDAAEYRHAELDSHQVESADPEDPNESRAVSICIWALAKMNLAIRGIDAQIAHGATFHNDRHPDLKADCMPANPPFNDSDWRGDLLKDDPRWAYGTPPAGNAKFAWAQHFIHHFAPTGLAGFVLANGSMSSNQSGEGEIRKAIIEADLVDCMVALPS